MLVPPPSEDHIPLRVSLLLDMKVAVMFRIVEDTWYPDPVSIPPLEFYLTDVGGHMYKLEEDDTPEGWGAVSGHSYYVRVLELPPTDDPDDPDDFLIRDIKPIDTQ